MIAKHQTLSYAFYSLLLFNTLASMLLCAATGTSAAQNQEIAQQTSEAITPDIAQQTNLPRKTAGQRIASGLSHTVLLGSSLLYFVFICANFTTVEKIAFGLLGTRGSYGSAQGIYRAITKSEISSEKPTTLNIYTIADSALLIPSLFLLKDLSYNNKDRSAMLFFSLPAVYALGTSLKTIYRLAQNHKSNSEAQEPEIHTITA